MFMNTENSKTNEPHKFVLNLSQRLDLSGSEKHVALKNMIKKYKTLTTIPPIHVYINIINNRLVSK